MRLAKKIIPTFAIIGVSTIGLAAPAHATTIQAPVVTKTALPSKVAAQPSIDWGKVVRIFGSQVECEAKIPWADAYYFPAFSYCEETGSGSYALVIKSVWHL